MDPIQNDKKQETLRTLEHVALMAKVTQAQLRLEHQPDFFLDEFLSGIEWLKAELPSMAEEDLRDALEALIHAAKDAAAQIQVKVDDVFSRLPPEENRRETRPL